MIAAALTDNIIGRQADIIRRDAEALLAVAAWADLPAGVAVLPLTGRPEASGASIGSGHALALAHGCRPGAVAVRVDVVGIMRAALTASADDAALGILAARPMIEAVAVHELAHALVHDPDDTSTAAEAVALVAACDAAALRTGADAHGPRWAAAVVVLTRRVIRLRPAHERPALKAAMHADLQAYGLDAAAVAEALGEIADEEPLRELLAAGGDVACRVARACPPDAERQASINEHRRQHGAAGGVIEASRRKAG
jgi:hypothetical protein